MDTETNISAQPRREPYIFERNALIAMAIGFFVIAGALLIAPPILVGRATNSANTTGTIAQTNQISYSESNAFTTTIIARNSIIAGYNQSGYEQNALNSTGYNQSGSNYSVTKDTPYPP